MTVEKLGEGPTRVWEGEVGTNRGPKTVDGLGVEVETGEDTRSKSNGRGTGECVLTGRVGQVRGIDYDLTVSRSPRRIKKEVVSRPLVSQNNLDGSLTMKLDHETEGYSRDGNLQGWRTNLSTIPETYRETRSEENGDQRHRVPVVPLDLTLTSTLRSRFPFTKILTYPQGNY